MTPLYKDEKQGGLAEDTTPTAQSNQVAALREEVRKIVRDKPYFMCRRCGGEVFCDFGRMTLTSMDAEMDRANEEYLEEAFVKYITKLTDLVATDKDTSNDTSNPQSSPSSDLQEILADYSLITHYDCDNDCHQKWNEQQVITALEALIQTRERAARIDELNAIQLNYGHYNAQTAMSGEVGNWVSIPDRIATLSNNEGDSNG